MNERDFFARLQYAGVLVRTQLSARNPVQITGYAVALPADTTPAGGPVWYSGGKPAPDLTLPKLCHRWHDPTASNGSGGQLTWAERDAIWNHAARTAATAADQIRHLAAADPRCCGGGRVGRRQYAASRCVRVGQPHAQPGR